MTGSAALEKSLGNVLLLEDNAIIALDAEDILLTVGASAVHVSTTVVDALAVLQTESIQLAMLDIHLREGTSEAVALELNRRKIPFICASGEHGENLQEFARGVPVVLKPFSEETVLRAFDEVRG